MRKENAVSVTVGQLNGRMTRARIAALRASGKLLPSKAPIEQDQKRILRPNSKRAALDENNTRANENVLVRYKKRAVLQDVTNVCCDRTYGSCFRTTKLQAKHDKQAKKGVLKVSKVAPAIAANLQVKSKKKIVQQARREEPKSEVLSSNTLEKEVASRLNYIQKLDTDINQLQNQTSRVLLEAHGPPKIEKCGLFKSSLTSSDTGFTDIDCDEKDPQLCSLYALDIYSNLRVAELDRRPIPTFMETIQKDISQSMRGILVDWLVEVSEEYKLVPDTLYLTVYLIDWFLSQNYIERHRLQLLGITCMLIASKYEEICAPRVEDFCFITDNTYTKEEVIAMEIQVLKYFGFQIFAPTTKTFLRRFLRAAQACYKSPSYELEYLADYLAELTLVEYSFLNFLPSLIAASAVFLARWTLDQTSHPWNPTLEHYSSYKASDLKSTVHAIQDQQLRTSGCPLNAVRMKYKQQKFKSVAALTSPELLATLFLKVE
ncbi:hypothetical protein K2173_024399 [Erythroxylum novogranatense]|uniref:B-like cyclin n=1 Tax=Erythroxylum novogranatense TaxID=1862640 RepID=A0AAV8SV09_9ROSI|nr:hypothetical protein K2173_024399 [Erythroxylum novogranatense]